MNKKEHNLLRTNIQQPSGGENNSKFGGHDTWLQTRPHEIFPRVHLHTSQSPDVHCVLGYKNNDENKVLQKILLFVVEKKKKKLHGKESNINIHIYLSQ